MIKKLYEKDENNKYVHSLLERNAIYGVISESNGLKKMKMGRSDTYDAYDRRNV